METNANVSDDLAKNLRKKRFFEISDEVSKGLNKNKVDSNQILENLD